jgi:DNA-binding CsgD family transcriptional regulator
MTLYPRLRTVEARPLIEAALSAPLEELQQDRPLLPRGIVWAPTGGVRVSEARLADLRELIREAAKAVGYDAGMPLEPRAPEGAALDRRLARVLYDELHLTPHEASAGDVWRYFACVLAPELVRWRFPGKEGSPQERFGTSLRRNLFGRMWWRAFIFHEPAASDPWVLLDALGEDEMVQITERPSAAGYRPLARGLARGLLRRHRQAPGLNRGNLLRDTMKRLLRRLPLLRYESLVELELDAALDELFSDSLRAAGAEVRQLTFPLAPPREAPPLPVPSTPVRPWFSISLTRRFAFVNQLDADDVAALTLELSPVDPLESEPRWALLRGLSVPHARVVAALPSAQRLTARLGSNDLEEWLAEGTPGSWVSEILPARALSLLRLLDGDWLRVWVGRTLGEAILPDAADLPRAILRQFDGEWSDLLGWIDADVCAGLLEMFSPGAPQTSDPRSILASWLVGRTVVAPSLGRLEIPQVDPWEEDVTEEETRPAPTESVAHTAFERALREARIADPRPIPEPPGLIRKLLARVLVRSLGDLARLDLATVADLPGVGKTKVEALRTWRIEVLGAEPVVPAYVPEPAPPLPPAFAARRLGPVPGLLQRLFIDLGIFTYGDLMAIDVDGLTAIEHVGRRKIELVQQMQEAARMEVEQPPPARSPAPDLSALETLVLDGVTGRERTLVNRRLIEGASLVECGQELGLSRERVRQLTSRVLDRLQFEHATDAAALLNAECGILADDRALHRQMAALATIPFERLRLPLSLVADGWALVDGEWMVRGGPAELDRLLSGVEEWIAGRQFIEATDLERAPVRQPLLGIILAEHCGMRTEGDDWVVDVSQFDRNTFLEERLRTAGTAHQDELARWLLARQGDEAKDAEVARAVRSVEGALSRLPSVYRTAMGTFTHREALPIPEAALARLVDLCVDRMRGTAGAISTRALLDQLRGEDDHAAVVSPWLLKDALKRHPDIKVLRKFLVGYAPTFTEEGVLLGDRLEAILREAGVPLTTQEITDRLPDGLEHADAAIYSTLRNGGFAVTAGRGRFIWSPDSEDRSEGA